MNMKKLERKCCCAGFFRIKNSSYWIWLDKYEFYRIKSHKFSIISKLNFKAHNELSFGNIQHENEWNLPVS